MTSFQENDPYISAANVYDDDDNDDDDGSSINAIAAATDFLIMMRVRTAMLITALSLTRGHCGS